MRKAPSLAAVLRKTKQREAQKYINEGKFILIKNASQSTLEAYRRSSILKEDRADIDGMDFLNNHPVLSVVGMALFLNCAKDDGLNKNGKDANEHRSLNERYNVAIDYIRKLSNGRVEIRNDLLYLDGQKFMSTGRLPARRDVTAYDRTIYVAGQLASAINHNLSAKSGSITFKGEYIENLYRTKKMTYFVVEPAGAEKPFFVMDFVPIEINRLNAILERRVQPQNDEERVVVEIMNFLNKNKSYNAKRREICSPPVLVFVPPPAEVEDIFLPRYKNNDLPESFLRSLFLFFGIVVYLESKRPSERLSWHLNGKSKKIGRITSDNHNLSEVIVAKKEGHKAPHFLNDLLDGCVAVFRFNHEPMLLRSMNPDRLMITFKRN